MTEGSMDLQQRLKQLEEVHDWQGMLEELEKALASESQPAAKAPLHLQIGKLLDEKLLQGVKALKHFQDAYKHQPKMIEALERARGIYWQLGKLNMVQRLLDLELKAQPEGDKASALLLEQADVLMDEGDIERATSTYARALGASNGANQEASSCLEDAQIESGGWQDRVAFLLRTAHAESTPAGKARMFVRAARIAKRFAPEELEGMLQMAVGADPSNMQAATLYENLLVEAGRTDDILALQRKVIAEAPDAALRAQNAFRFGVRWITRHQNLDIGAELLADALIADPSTEAALLLVREVYGTRDGNWDKVMQIADKALSKAADQGTQAFLLAQIGVIAWQKAGNLLRARKAFEQLCSISPDHPSVAAFEAQIGQKLTPSELPQPEPSPAAPPVSRAKAPAAASKTPAPAPVKAAPAAPAAPAVAAEPEPPPAAREASAPELAIETSEVTIEAGAGDDDDLEIRIIELREQAQKQEASKRFNEYVKTLVALAEIVPDVAEKVELNLKAADLYQTKFANQAEAIKAYERVLEAEPDNQSAIQYLLQMYEKRRDWENLIRLRRLEADRSDSPRERTSAYLAIAKLATERLRKPEACIPLWQEVLNSDAENEEALNALSTLYEHARSYDLLATVLEKQAEITADLKKKSAILTKLGQLYGDRLNNDDGAVNAWRQLLALTPDDRRAQEALRKKYLALGRWDDLEVFYAESGKWDEFIRVLEGQEGKETDPQAKIKLLMKIAQLWRDQKSKLDRAAAAFEKVLGLDAQFLAAAEALVPIYQQTGNAKGLAAAIEVKLGHEEDEFARLELLREVAVLYEQKVKDPDKAFERYLAAFEISPGDDACRDDMERVANLTNRWADVIASYRRSIIKSEADSEHHLSIALHLKLGRVLVEEVSSIEQALAEFRSVYDADGENAEAIQALESLYRRTSKFDELLGIYEKKRELASDFNDKREVLYAIAQLYEAEMKQPDRAIETYRAVLQEDPTDLRSLKSLDALYSQLQDFPSYVEILRALIELDVTEPELIDLKYRLGSTLEKHLSDPAGALDNYKEILFLDQSHEGARAALETMLSNPDLMAEAAAILDPIYEARSDWEKLVGVLEVLAAGQADVTARVDILRRIARTAAGQLNDLQRALDAQARALKEDPSNTDARGELEAFADEAKAWNRLEVIFNEIAEGLSDVALAREYWMRLAAIEERLGKIDEAAAGYGRVLSLDATDSEALAALDALYRRTERWSDLITVYRRRIELAEDLQAREKLYAQMAQVFEEKLGRPEDAIAAYREVLSLDETSQVALVALDALFTRQKMWNDLADNLEAQLRLAETDDAEIKLMLRLASLREKEMGQVDQAIEIYRQVLDREATDETALAALERLGTMPDYELQIAEILEPLYRQTGDFKKLIGVHEVQVRRSDDPMRKVELLHQIASLNEDAAGDLNAAFDTLARALSQDPSHEETQQGLDRLARATSRFGDLAKVFESLAAGQEDPQLASQLYSMSAKVYEQDLNDVDNAVAHYRKVLSIDPMNLAAAEALEGLFRATERYADLSLVLQRKAEIVEDTADKKGALFQAAGIEEDMLEKPDAAIQVYLKILDIDPEDLKAVDALVKQYLGLKRWEELLSVYTKKADLVDDPEEKKLIFFQMGAVYDRELGDVARAIDTYQRVLELDPDDLQALGRLDVLYQTSQNWQDLLSVLQHEAELTMDPAEAISYQYRIADLYEKHLGDVPRAIELYRDILMQQADHSPTLEALERLKDGKVEPLAAASVLEPFYDAAGEWAKLISVLEVQVRFQEDAFEKVQLLHRIASLYEDNLQNHHAAFDTFARALGLDNSNADSLAALERLANVTDRWSQTAQLYDAELAKLDENPDWLVELGLRTATIYEVQLEDVDNAVARYRKVLSVAADNQKALSSLDRLFQQTDRWGDLAQVLVREAEIAQSGDEALEFKYRLGQVYQVRLNDLDQAVLAYRDVLNTAPEHESTLGALEGLFASGTKQAEIAEILEPLYEEKSEWDKLSRVYDAQLANLKVPEDRLAMFYRMAELCEDKLLDPDKAMDVYVRAVKEFPIDEKVGEEIERLANSVDGGWDKLGNAYADVLDVQTDPQVQKTIGKRHARVFEIELQQVDNAIATYRYVLGVDPLEPEALANLDRIFEALEQWQDLAQILEQRVKATQDTTELIELYTRLGQTYEDKLNQVDNSIRAYRVIFDKLEPAHEGAIQALGRLYELKGAWTELNMVYERELGNAIGDAQEAEIRAKIAHLTAERLGDLNSSIETWKRVLDLRGEDSEALAALGNLYETQQMWAELCDVLEREFDIASEDEERVAVRLRRARVFLERLNRDEEALEDFSRVLEIDYGNADALRSIANIWRTRNDPNELVASLHNMVDRAGPALEAAELKAIFRELGITYGGVLQQPYDAADAWTKLLEVDPGDFEALDALEGIYTADERWTDVVDVKMRRAEALEDPAEKIRELLEVTDIWQQKVGERDSGTIAFEKVLGIDPTHDRAFLALEELHTAAGRWEPLIELYLARLDTRDSVSETTEILRKIARVFEEKVDDKGQAFDALVKALEEDYSDNETSRYLEKMAQATNRWSELIQQANTWLQAEKDPQKIIQLCLRLAKWYGEDLGHTQYAQPYFQKVMQLDPTNVAVLRQMASLYRKNTQWQELGRTLTEALKHASSESDRKEIQTELGELLEKQLSDVDKGVIFYKNALEVDPHYLPALEALERIYGGREQYRELVEILGRKVVALKDSAEMVAGTKVRMGGLFESTLNDPEKAAGAYNDALEVDPSNLLAMRGLERIYNLTQNWQALVKVLEQQLDVVATERERIETLMKLAGIFEEQFLKPEEAAVRLEQVLEIDPTHEQALVALERCYRKQRQWLDLVNAYERHINATVDRNLKVELYGSIAQVFAVEVEDTDRAIDAYRSIVDLDETNVGAIDSLAKLYEKQGSAADAIEYMTKVAELTADSAQRVEMFYRIGRALDTQLGDRVAAQERYEMALDLDPSHLASLAALKEIALDAGEWDQAARYLDQEQLHTPAPRQRSKLLVELGKLRDEKLEEHEPAVQAYELAMQADPENEDAARPLVEEYAARERWTEAEPLADMLLKKAAKLERSEQHYLYKMQGKIAAALGNDDKSLKAYKEALHLDLTDQESIRGIAEVSFRLGDWAGALTNYQKVLTSLEEDQREDRANVYHKLGRIKRAQGQLKQAINNFEKALAIDDAHRPTLEAMVEIYAELKDWKQVCAYKRQILDNVMDGDERFLMLNEIGDTWAEKEKNLPKAIETLEEALDLKPDNHVLLHKLLQHYQASKNFERMIDTIQRIADLEPSPERKARYLYTMAQLHRDRQELDRAVELFNEALDLNPDFLEAFERINKILTGQKDWKQLERSFRKMIHRVAGKGKTDLEYNLWHNLGIIYRDRIKEVDAAIESFKMASRLKPEEVMERQILAELYESASQFDLAIEEQQEILRRDPTQVAPYRSLYQLYYAKQAFDEAWCMCAALAFLKRADEDQLKFFEDYRPKGIPAARNRLDNEMWVKYLFHRDEDIYVGKIFEMLTGAALQAKIRQLTAAKQLPVLDKRYKQEPHSTTVTFAKTFFHVAKVEGITPPELYVRNDIQGGLIAAPAIPFASVAGQSVLSGFTPHELAFIVGKHLALYRGEHYIKNIFATTTELTQLFFAGLRMVLPDAPVPPEAAQSIDVTAKALAPLMQPTAQEGLRHVVKKFMEAKGAINVKRWVQSTELTACRAGFVMCGDLEIAKKVLLMEPQLPGDLSPQEKITELIVFSISAEYFALRKALGFAIA
ncbi:MAG: tetratricopeptide repeat protein [Deltaproteobacteria bacterium]|nr:tetratricopeptide repeat protein [Deltaproteobacteria bacterium]